MPVRLLLLPFLLADLERCHAHDAWQDGSPVPGWVKQSCCGPTDVHHLKPEQVSRNVAGDWIVDIYPFPIPSRAALPSQDNNYWIFFGGEGTNVTPVRCMFVPMSF